MAFVRVLFATDILIISTTVSSKRMTAIPSIKESSSAPYSAATFCASSRLSALKKAKKGITVTANVNGIDYTTKVKIK